MKWLILYYLGAKKMCGMAALLCWIESVWLISKMANINVAKDVLSFRDQLLLVLTKNTMMKSIVFSSLDKYEI